MLDQYKELESKDYTDTVFVRDIETRVFQAVTVKCLSNIEGISLLEGNLFDNLLGREGTERIKGIHVEQDTKSHSVNIRIELNIAYGVSIPEKSEEIQSRIVEDITKLTGLHVASVHIIFKNVLPEKQINAAFEEKPEEEVEAEEGEIAEDELGEYSEDF